MKDLTIFIPSLGRASKITAMQSTLSELPAAALPFTRLVVPTEQVPAYADALARRSELRAAEILPCPVSGIAAVRRWIAEQSSTEKILMLDDDIKFQVRTSFSNNKFDTYPSAESKMDMLEAVSTMLDTYAHGGISDRVAGSRAALGVGPPCIIENTRLLRALAYRRTEHMSCEHGRVDVMEDFDIALQLLRRGFKSGNVAWWVQDQRTTQWAGGCSTYRTHELHETSAKRLAELHPEFVKLRQKQNKTGGEFGTRTEVTIQWKQAYESAAQ